MYSLPFGFLFSTLLLLGKIITPKRAICSQFKKTEKTEKPKNRKNRKCYAQRSVCPGCPLNAYGLGTVGDVTKCSQQFPECDGPPVPNSAKVISRPQGNCWEQSVTSPNVPRTRATHMTSGQRRPCAQNGFVSIFMIFLTLLCVRFFCAQSGFLPPGRPFTRECYPV